VVPKVDVPARRVVIDPPDGLLDGRTVESEAAEIAAPRRGEGGPREAGG